MHDRAAVTLPEPDEYADLTQSGGEVDVPVWHLNGGLFDDLGKWVRAASSVAPMEIAGHDVDTADLHAMEQDLLALLAAVRASRVLDAAQRSDIKTTNQHGIERAD